MSNKVLAAAIASALGVAGSGMALAAEPAPQVFLFMSGASAQRDFWTSTELGNICVGGSPGGIREYRIADTTTPAGHAPPDFRAYACTLINPLPARYNAALAGKTVIVSYAAELGSIWGIAPFVGNPANPNVQHSYLDPTDASCPVVANGAKGNCSITGYSDNTDTVTTGTALKRAIPDAGLMDAEPTQWSNQSVNWPTFVAVGQPAPTKAALQGIITAGAQRVNDQVFGVFVNKANAPTSTITNLSRTSLYNIFSGTYSDWVQVPEVGVAQRITVCRRDVGSGTQVSAQTFFNASSNCGSGSPFVTATSGTGPIVSINNSSDDLITFCVGTTAGAVGFRSLQTSTKYNTVANLINVDGITPSAGNAATGAFTFAYETYAYVNPTTGQGGANARNLANGLIVGAQQSAVLNTADAKSPGNIALGDIALSGNVSTIASANVPSGNPAQTAVGSRSGNSCQLPKALNAN